MSRSTPARTAAVVSCALLLAAGCGGGDSDGGTAPVRPPPARLALDSTSLSLFSRQSARLQALGPDRQPLGAGAGVRWQPENGSIAGVDSTGWVTAGTVAGVTRVSAIRGADTATAVVTVRVDDAAPSVSEVSFPTTLVDVAQGPVTVTARLRASDAASGVTRVSVQLSPPASSSPDGLPTFNLPCGGAFAVPRASGTAADGVYECSVTLNQFVPPGTWRAGFTASDASTNTGGAPGVTFEVRGSRADVTAPTVTGVTLPRDSADVRTSTQFITYEVLAADAESGLYGLSVFFTSDLPSPNASRSCTNFTQVILGADAAGPLRCFLSFDSNTPTSTWRLSRIQLRDLRGNVRTLESAALDAAGLTRTVRVTGR